MSTSTSAPVASKHVFLHDVAKLPIGMKVRFLCCVLNYEVSKAYLHVEHSYPREKVPIPTAIVEISQVLETIRRTEIQPGSWLNVIGYVRRSQSGKNKRKRPADDPAASEAQLVVQAVLVWDAGAIKLAEYERTLSHQREIQARLAPVLAGRARERDSNNAL